MAKVIAADNFARETVDDHLVARDISWETAEQMAKELNDGSGPDAQRYYRAVPDDYQLQRWEP